MKYCKYCGKEVLDEAIICPNCYNSFQRTYKLVVYREKFNVLNSKKMEVRVEINNEVKGTLYDNECLELKLKEGFYKLNIYYLLHKNKKRSEKVININLIKDVRLEVNYNNFSGGLQIMEIK